MIFWMYSALPTVGHDTKLATAFGHYVRAVGKSGLHPDAKIAHYKPKLDLSGPTTKQKWSLSILPVAESEIHATYLPGLPTIEPTADDQQTAASAFAGSKAKLVTLNLSSTAIESVISILSKQTGVNIVLMSKADQKVTLNVRNMPLMDALKHLSMLAGVRVLNVNNTMVMADEQTLKSAYPVEYDKAYAPKVETKVDPKADPKEDPKNIKVDLPVDTVERIYTLQYQGGTQVANALKEYVSGKKVTIIALPNTTIPTLGTGSNGGLNSVAGTGSTQTGAAAEGRLKRVLVSGPVPAVEDVLKLLSQMDIPRKQVEIRVTIHDVSNDALKDAGFTWDFGQTNITEAVNGNFNVGTFSRTGLSFVNTIHALEQTNKAKLLASPNVSVMDGELGSMLIGEKRRFPVVTGTNSNGQFIYSTEEQNVGIYLLVSSDVAEDGTITLAVNAQVSSILGFLQLNGGSYPQISTRESKSTLILKDGQTMVMGGLLRDEEIVNLQKVPLLGQIPFFGELFNSRKKQKNSSQLIISITPRVVSSQ